MRINIPPFTRLLLGLLIGFSLVYQAASYRARSLGSNTSNVIPWITLTPQLSVYYPWVYATATLAEQNIITLVGAGATFFFGGRYLERAWGSSEFVKFILVTTVIPNLATAALYVVAFLVSRSDSVAYV
jgi:membrane associated rhomboid family serine protease